MKRLACVLAMFATGCPQEPGPPPSCEPVTSEFVVVAARPQEPTWGAPCVPLFEGDSFQWTQHGTCPQNLSAEDVPMFVSVVAPECTQSQGGPIVCVSTDADAGADARVLVGNTVEGDLYIEWREITDSGDVVECIQQFDVRFVRTIPRE